MAGISETRSILLNIQKKRIYRESTIDHFVHEYNMRIFDDICIHESEK